jgi:hypothetical protein
VIALNFSDDTAKDQSITVGHANGTAKVLGEDRSVALKDGALSDNFGPYEVRIYELAK